MMEALNSSERFVYRRATLRNISEDGILHSHRCENLKSYIVLYLYTLKTAIVCVAGEFLSIQNIDVILPKLIAGETTEANLGHFVLLNVRIAVLGVISCF
jgi:hypothetical protein